MTTNNGGPAFPFTADGYDPHKGMSLRDYFAAEAMQALVNKTPWYAADADSDDLLGEIEQFRYDIAISAYGYADAMIAAREETEQ